MASDVSNFLRGGHAPRIARWNRWAELIERDRNYARILLCAPLVEPISPQVAACREELDPGWRDREAIRTAGRHL